MEMAGANDEDSIRAQLQKLVECPVCYESMTETEMCVNGHTVCVRCRRQLNICPVCNKAFGNIRNRLGEGVSELLAFKPCTNISRGCPKYLAEKDCRKHEQSCSYRLYPCKVCSTQLCFFELKDHILRNHENSLIEPYITKELTAEDFVEAQTHFLLVEFNGESFWFWWKHTEVNTFFGLQYCGEAEKCSSYKYNFQLVSKNGKSDFEFTGPVIADSRNVHRYKYPEDYAVLSKAFFSEGAKYQVSVTKID